MNKEFAEKIMKLISLYWTLNKHNPTILIVGMLEYDLLKELETSEQFKELVNLERNDIFGLSVRKLEEPSFLWVK